MNVLLGAILGASLTMANAEEVCSAAMSVWPVVQCQSCDPTKLEYLDVFDVQMYVKNMAISQSSRAAVRAELKDNSKLFLWFGCRQSECTSMTGSLEITGYEPNVNSAMNIGRHNAACGQNWECSTITIFARINLGVPSGASLSSISDAVLIGVVQAKVVGDAGGVFYLRADSGVSDLEIPADTGCIPVTGGGQGSTAVLLLTTTTTITSTTTTTTTSTTSSTSTTTTTTWKNYCCAIFENVAPESHFCFPHMEPIENGCAGVSGQSMGELWPRATEMVAHTAMAELMTAETKGSTANSDAAEGASDHSHADFEFTLIGVAILMAVSTSVMTACLVAFCMKRLYIQQDEHGSEGKDGQGAFIENADLQMELARLQADVARVRLENAHRRSV